MFSKFPNFQISKFVIHLLIVSIARGDAYDYDDILAQLHSQHLDEPRRAPQSYTAIYSPKTAFEGYGETDVGEFAVDLRLVDLDYGFGRFDLRLFGHATAFFENPDMSNLPDALLEAGADLGFNIRFDNGWSWEIRAAPGVYSDVVAPAFGIPLTLNSYFAADPTLSFQIGATYRHDWAVPVVPNLGVAWQPAEEVRIEAGIPKSKLTLFGNYAISPFATFEWRSITYAMSGKDGAPKDLTFEDMIMTAGVSISPLLTWSVSAEIGTYLHRHLSASVSENTTVHMSKENFFRFAIKTDF